MSFYYYRLYYTTALIVMLLNSKFKVPASSNNMFTGVLGLIFSPITTNCRKFYFKFVILSLVKHTTISIQNLVIIFLIFLKNLFETYIQILRHSCTRGRGSAGATGAWAPAEIFQRVPGTNHP